MVTKVTRKIAKFIYQNIDSDKEVQEEVLEKFNVDLARRTISIYRNLPFDEVRKNEITTSSLLERM